MPAGAEHDGLGAPAMAKSLAFARIRAEVIRLVALIPKGRFTTYGSIALHMNCTPRHVAQVLSRLTEEESARLPWQRVVAAEGRISRGMDPELAARHNARIIDASGNWYGESALSATVAAVRKGGNPAIYVQAL